MPGHRITFAAVALALIGGATTAAGLDRQDAKGLSFQVHSSIEIARRTNGGPASLYLICTDVRKLHLLLLARLPGRSGVGKGRDDVVSLFVNGIDRQLHIVVDIVDKGKEVSWTTKLLGGDDSWPPDTIVTPPLSDVEITSLETWFGNSPPEKVSVVGILETGVFMRGSSSGEEIRKQRADCQTQ